MSVLLTLIKSFQLMIELGSDVSRAFFSEDILKPTVQILMAILAKSVARERRRQEIAENEEDFDEECALLVEGENDYEDELRFLVSECFGALIGITKDAFLPAFASIFALFEQYLTPAAGSSCRKTAVYILDDVIQYVPNACDACLEKLVPLFLDCCRDESFEVRQAALYGLGQMAEQATQPQRFGPFAQQIVEMCLATVTEIKQQQQQSGEEDANRLGQMFQTMPSPHSHVSSSFGRTLSTPKNCFLCFSLCLPLQKDSVENARNLEFLLTALSRNDTMYLGEDWANVPQIIRVFLDSVGEDILQEEPGVVREDCGHLENHR
eukprot:GABV01000662.1.p1 GENE.GABV01000662.1~~GABV01000662.1.p1  ORF type:complete len:359 (+),score=107.53 GABV01000662.1:109-1077(+)